MSNKLVIVESPAKAKTIGRILGNDYIIKASMGHVRDLPEKAFGVDLEHGFKPQYEESKSRERNLNDLKKTAKKVDDIYLASDPDREGEAIAWHLREILAAHNKKAAFHRVSFHEITKSAIAKAFQTPGDINMDLVDSQQARRVLDRIVGYLVSPLLWSRIERGVSAGRVQSVALRLVCEREREINAFVPKEYWNFAAQFEAEKEAGSNRFFTAKLAKIDSKNVDVKNGEDAQNILNAIRSVNDWFVASLETKPYKKSAYPPFITSTLQQAASSSLGFSANQTMRIAQQLYEGVDVGGAPLGLITYMRTDSVAVSVEAQNSARNFISSEFGADYVPERPNIYRSKSNAQGAHEAIRPTDITMTPEKLKMALDVQQLKLYTLIWRRFIASQMAQARQMRTTVEVEPRKSLDNRVYTFRSTATVTTFPGYLRAYNIVDEGTIAEDDEDTRNADILGALGQNDELMIAKPAAEQKFTEPAPRYSEATLIKELETNGIGRPSTYAAIVNTIQTRKYVNKEKGKLIPTELGFKINDYLVVSLPELFQVGFTAGMETELDGVEEGNVLWTEMLDNFYSKFSNWLEDAKGAGAPEQSKAKALIKYMHDEITSWIKVERIPGKRMFDDKKFFESVCLKYKKTNSVSEKQWETLLSLALKYDEQLPELHKIAEENNFLDDLKIAEERRDTLEQERNERRIKQEAATATAPSKEKMTTVFDAMSKVKWEVQEVKKRNARVFDDKKFFDSLKKQSEMGKSLSEKQIAVLGRMLLKYADQIPGYEIMADILGVDTTPPEAETAQAEDISELLKTLSAFTKWDEPVKRGNRIYNDKDFMDSIHSQVEKGKTLSAKQIAAVKRLADKYKLL